MEELSEPASLSFSADCSSSMSSTSSPPSDGTGVTGVTGLDLEVSITIGGLVAGLWPSMLSIASK